MDAGVSIHQVSQMLNHSTVYYLQILWPVCSEGTQTDLRKIQPGCLHHRYSSRESRRDLLRPKNPHRPFLKHPTLAAPLETARLFLMFGRFCRNSRVFCMVTQCRNIITMSLRLSQSDLRKPHQLYKTAKPSPWVQFPSSPLKTKRSTEKFRQSALCFRGLDTSAIRVRKALTVRYQSRCLLYSANQSTISHLLMLEPVMSQYLCLSDCLWNAFANANN